MSSELPVQLEQSTAQLLEFIRTTAEQSKDFVVEQAPLFVQEYLRFHLIDNAIYLAIFIAFIGLFITIGVKIWRSFSKHPAGSDANAAKFIAILPWLIAASLFIFATSPISNIVKIKVAPRVFLVDNLLGKVIK